MLPSLVEGAKGVLVATPSHVELDGMKLVAPEKAATILWLTYAGTDGDDLSHAPGGARTTRATVDTRDPRTILWDTGRADRGCGVSEDIDHL